MKESKSVTKDPICGMTVDEATSLSPNAMQKDVLTFAMTIVGKDLCPPTGAKPEENLTAVEGAGNPVRTIFAKIRARKILEIHSRKAGGVFPFCRTDLKLKRSMKKSRGLFPSGK